MWCHVEGKRNICNQLNKNLETLHECKHDKYVLSVLFYYFSKEFKNFTSKNKFWVFHTFFLFNS